MDWCCDLLLDAPQPGCADRKDNTLAVVCCPEDVRRTSNCTRCRAGSPQSKPSLCEHCEVPVCQGCMSYMKKGGMPPEALANDMWFGYAPDILYSENVTVVEMICASPCFTSMVCLSLEVKYGNTYNTEVHMQRHRVGARGNVTCFPLPWESLLVHLQALGNQHNQTLDMELPTKPELPRSGVEVADVVRVLLKSNASDKVQDLKSIIHQARVRRKVVLSLIEGGHVELMVSLSTVFGYEPKVV